MAYCSKCGERMEENIIYSPKTHKRIGSEFICPVHGVDQNPVRQTVGRTNPCNYGGRDWGTIMKNR